MQFDHADALFVRTPLVDLAAPDTADLGDDLADEPFATVVSMQGSLTDGQMSHLRAARNTLLELPPSPHIEDLVNFIGQFERELTR